jgi:hypothetical protein
MLETLAEETGFEPIRWQLQRLLAYRLAHSPMVERPGIEPGPSVLQTDAQTMYAISRWLRRRELNSRGEVMSLAVSPDTRHIKKHRLVRDSRECVLDVRTVIPVRRNERS